MARADIAVVGASAGGVAALQALARGLPQNYAGTLFVVLHVGATSPGTMPQILAESGALPAKHPADGEQIRPGHIYIAPPDHHMLLRPNSRIHLSCGPKENHARPAIDPLFRSAALSFGERVAGVILTGRLDDGTAGLTAIKEAGGIAIVQDPRDAEVPDMPKSALKYTEVDYCLELKEIAPLLAHLAMTDRKQLAKQLDSVMSKNLETEVAIASNETSRPEDIMKLGAPSIFACPECHGTLLRMHHATPPRFRCHTGHGFTIGALEAFMSEQIETQLWNSIRSLEEYALLLKELAEKQSEGETGDWRGWSDRAMHRAAKLRQLLADDSTA